MTPSVSGNTLYFYQFGENIFISHAKPKNRVIIGIKKYNAIVTYYILLQIFICTLTKPGVLLEVSTSHSAEAEFWSIDIV